MNKRIKELVKKSGLDGQLSCSVDEWDHQELEQFVSLIVKECSGIYDAIENGNMQEGTYRYLEAIHKRFGLDK